MKTTPPIFILTFTILLTSTIKAHNITQILSNHPEFSTFNTYLTKTHLANKINTLQTVTVCAVHNDAVSSFINQTLPISSIKNVLSLHILLDYLDTQKLHDITNSTTLISTLPSTLNSSAFVNITDLKGGKIGFTAKDMNNDANFTTVFVKSVESKPLYISVIHISSLLQSPVALAPAPSQTPTNLIVVMSAHGCKLFSQTLATFKEAIDTFQGDLDGGLTVFCPKDDAFKSFIPKFKNMTAEAKVSLLLYHGLPVYNSLSMLRSNNGLMNTLATDGAKKFDLIIQNDGNVVTIDTKRSVARISGTLVDEEPLAIFSVDKVLLPKELFKAVEAPTPAPAPAEEAEAPKPGKKADSDADEPADASSEDDSGDVANVKNGVVGVGVLRVVVGLGFGVWLSLVVM